MRSAHAREIDDLERAVARKEREKRDLEEELRDSRDELRRERETVRELKVCRSSIRICEAEQQQSLSQQSTQHLTLTAQLTATQNQLAILQGEVERATLSVSSMKGELEIGRQEAKKMEERAEQQVREAEEERDRRIAEIELELREAETIRRKLHNQVQELKGNIRVFARVRPALGTLRAKSCYKS